MKRLLIILSLFISVALNAQNATLTSQMDSVHVLLSNFRNIKSHVNLEFAGSGNAYLTEGELDEMSFKMNRVRLEVYGNLNRQISYHFRQSFNKYSNPYSVDNISSSIEYAYIQWHPGDKFDLLAGKQYLALAGYEGYVNALLVREFSDFNNNVEVFQTGVMGIYKMTPTQHLMFQIANNRNSSDSEMYMYGIPSGVRSTAFPLLATLNWNGWFADGAVHLMYSASAGQLAKDKNIYYLMCGNIYEKGPILAYLDVLYSRSALDQQQRITALQGQMRGALPVTAQNTEYFTVIANFDYRFHPKWNAYIKGAYETADVYKDNGRFAKGRYMTTWNAQACVEWFPFAEDKGFKVFAHYLYKGASLSDKAIALGADLPHTQRISLGIQYVISVL